VDQRGWGRIPGVQRYCFQPDLQVGSENWIVVFLEGAGYTGAALPIYDHVNVNCSGRLCVALIGTNGLARDREGRLIVCTHGDRTLYRLEKDGTRTVLADRYGGKRLSGPNDLAVKSDGSIYFSDRGSGLISGNVFPGVTNPLRELDYNAIMRWKEGKVDVILKDERVNGLAFSPDEKYLYLILSGTINRYDLQSDGTIANPKLFLDTRADKTPGAPDGMKVDRNGNVFTSGPGGVWIVSPEGAVLGRFEPRLHQQIYLLAMTTVKDCILRAAARCITFGLTPPRSN